MGYQNNNRRHLVSFSIPLKIEKWLTVLNDSLSFRTIFLYLGQVVAPNLIGMNGKFGD